MKRRTRTFENLFFDTLVASLATQELNRRLIGMKKGSQHISISISQFIIQTHACAVLYETFQAHAGANAACEFPDS